MRKFMITVNGTAYEVEVEELGASTPAAATAAPVAPTAAPAAPKAAPAPAAPPPAECPPLYDLSTGSIDTALSPSRSWGRIQN